MREKRPNVPLWTNGYFFVLFPLSSHSIICITCTFFEQRISFLWRVPSDDIGPYPASQPCCFSLLHYFLLCSHRFVSPLLTKGFIFNRRVPFVSRPSRSDTQHKCFGILHPFPLFWPLPKVTLSIYWLSFLRI
jgi:hypothetical protein